MSRIYYLLITLSALLASSCSCEKKVDITIDDLAVDIHNDFFRGIKPNIRMEELVEIAGEPIDFIISPGNEVEGDHSPVYYLKNGRVICHWSEDDEFIGMVEYIPYYARPIYIDSLLKREPSEYKIKSSIPIVRVYRDNVLYYLINLDQFQVTNIEYWMAKRELFNVAF